MASLMRSYLMNVTMLSNQLLHVTMVTDITRQLNGVLFMTRDDDHRLFVMIYQHCQNQTD